jgi:membrane protease subunit HflK
MADEKENKIQNTEKESVTEQDIAGKSLSEAFGISFIILKVIMVILVVLFLLSGFQTVEPGEKALVLRFGKIRGMGEDRILDSGLHWIFPYPVDEMIKISVSRKVNLEVDSFWYYQDPREKLGEDPQRPERVRPTLNPIVDGYCLTRAAHEVNLKEDFTNTDYNIVHSKWQITYQISNPEKFFRNAYVDMDSIQAGQNYSYVIAENINPFLKTVVDDAVVTAMVHYTIDEALFEQISRVTDHVKKLVQAKLDQTGSGIEVVSMQLTEKTWPRQVDRAFQASIKASQRSKTMENEAESYFENTLNQAAGPVAMELYEVINSGREADKQMWDRVAGQGRQTLSEARAYRTKVVEDAKASAEYLEQILPEYKKRPKLVIQKIYQDAVSEVLDNAKEKMIIQPSDKVKNKELRIMINRDPAIKQQQRDESK